MEPTRLFEIVDKQVTEFGHKNDLLCGKHKGEWIKYDANTYKDYVDAVSYGLLKMGYKPGTKIATVSNNRPEWNFLDMGMSQAGIIHVPIYPTISLEDYEYILEHCEAEMLIVSDKFLYKKLNPVASKINRIKEIITIDNVDGVKNWKVIYNHGVTDIDSKIELQLREIKKSISPHDVCTIIYTSGTTGTSKGVMLTHENFLFQSRRLKYLVDVDHRHNSLSFLPLCHVFERVVNYSLQYLGVSIYYAEGFETIAENLKEVRPNLFTTVPRLLERVYDKIMQKGNKLKGYKRKLFFWAVKLGHKFELGKTNPVYNARLAIANQLIFSQWRKALGGRIKFVISGGAALQPRLAKIFWAAGIPVREGYGLTETAPVICLNGMIPGVDIKIGTVGPKIGAEQEIKIASDGEILFKGPNLMKGYFKADDLTKQVIDEDGWFHTGDVGVIEDGKFLKITDRKKEIFKLSTGKYIAPQVIENLFKGSLLIEQVLITGENYQFPGAVIVPNFEYLSMWAKENDIAFTNNREFINNSKVNDLYKKEIIELNKKLGQIEKVNVFTLVSDDWTPATGELSPTLKLKRKFLHNKYNDLIIQMFEKKGNK